MTPSWTSIYIIIVAFIVYVIISIKLDPLYSLLYCFIIYGSWWTYCRYGNPAGATQDARARDEINEALTANAMMTVASMVWLYLMHDYKQQLWRSMWGAAPGEAPGAAPGEAPGEASGAALGEAPGAVQA